MIRIKDDIFRYKPVIVIGIALLLLSIGANSVFLASKNQQTYQYPDGLEIEEYAQSFLQGEEREEQGKKFDCSGFTREVFKHFGTEIARSSIDQYKQSNSLSVDHLKKGNLVFFCTGRNEISHVGIFLENGKFIHSPARGKFVRIDSLNNEYWKKRFVLGGKIVI